MTPKSILIDTDPGIDDALAILLAAASSEVQLEGVTVVHGNCPLKQGVVNALSILELIDATHIPVVAGLSRPLVKEALFAEETHGPQGLGYATLDPPSTDPVDMHAVDFLIDAVLSKPGEVSIVAIGPLTNIALAMRMEPALQNAVREVIIMGGAIRHQGNTTPLAEYNTYADPHAAHIVFHSEMPITLVPLDVTYQCLLTSENVNSLLERGSSIAEFIDQATRYYMEFHDSYQSMQGCVINDPLALALTFAPELCDYKELYVDVDLSGGVSMGNTFADFYHLEGKQPNMRVALDVKPRAFIQLFMTHMEKLMEKEVSGKA